MNTTTRHNSAVNPIRRSLTFLGAACLILLTTLSPFMASPGNAQLVHTMPVLQRVVASTTPDFVSVSGLGFTPGGEVFVVVHDKWGDELYPRVSTVASRTTYGENGSQDPAQGYTQPGVIHVQVALFSMSISGTNGSQDPAQGYFAGNMGSLLENGIDLFVNAYDVQADTWSNLVVAGTGTRIPVEIAPAAVADPATVPSCEVGSICELP